MDQFGYYDEEKHTDKQGTKLRTVDLSTGTVSDIKKMGSTPIRIPEHPRALTMFLLTMKTADDFLTLAATAESIEFLDTTEAEDTDHSRSRILRLAPTCLGYKMYTEDTFEMRSITTTKFTGRYQMKLPLESIMLRGDMYKDLMILINIDSRSRVLSAALTEYSTMMPCLDKLKASYSDNTFIFQPTSDMWTLNHSQIRPLIDTLVITSREPLVLPVIVTLRYYYVAFIGQNENVESVLTKNVVRKVDGIWQNVRTRDGHTYRSETYHLLNTALDHK